MGQRRRLPLRPLMSGIRHQLSSPLILLPSSLASGSHGHAGLPPCHRYAISPPPPPSPSPGFFTLLGHYCYSLSLAPFFIYYAWLAVIVTSLRHCRLVGCHWRLTPRVSPLDICWCHASLMPSPFRHSSYQHTVGFAQQHCHYAMSLSTSLRRPPAADIAISLSRLFYYLRHIGIFGLRAIDHSRHYATPFDSGHFFFFFLSSSFSPLRTISLRWYATLFFIL